MAKSSGAAIFLVYALCFLSLMDMAVCETKEEKKEEKDKFIVEGRVYCDTCRIQFFTKVSKFLEGAKVKFECRDREDGGNVTFTGDAETDKNGEYSIEVDGDHEEEVCETTLIKSVDPDCDEIPNDGYGHRARVSVTANNGITNKVRQANPLGFMKKEKLPQCKEVLRELGFDEAGLPV